MSQYPYTGPYSTSNQPSSLGTGTGIGTTGLGTGTGTGYGTTGLTTGSGPTGTGTGTSYATSGLGTAGLGTGIHTGYTSTDPHYIPSSTTGTHNIQN